MKRPPHRFRLTFALVAATALTLTSLTACNAGHSDPYPQRVVQVVVPYPAGSGIDTTTRALVDIINEEGAFDHDLQILNREGGGGTVGTTEVLNARADGYTIGVVPDGPLTLVPQTEEVAYDPEAATVLSEIITSPIMFVVPANSPYDDLQDLIDAAEASPSAVTIGVGPLNYTVPAEQFEQETGTKLRHVNFDGDQATTTALLGNNVDVGVIQLASALPQLESGQLRALGVTSEEDVELIPEVPTFRTQGADIVWEAFNFVVAPEGLPDEVSEALEEAISGAVDSPEFAEAADQLGLIVSGAGPDEAAEHLREKTESSASFLGDSE